MKYRYVLVGTGHRASYMFAKPLANELSEYAEVVGICDMNPSRADVVRRMAGLDCPVSTDFDHLIAEVKPDRAIIATRDATHDEYIVKCLEAGIVPISEKPMTTDGAKCKAILEAEQRSGLNVIVTFNGRFIPYVARIRQALIDGVVGEVLGVDYEYMLSTSHGSDYFRRWHRQKRNSGGLLIHKATHHFDNLNWWIGQEPAEVMAFGTRRKYGPSREERGERCLTCQHQRRCEFFMDIRKDDFYREMYLDCEDDDGYIRDGCVFSEEIDIEDTMSVNVRYAGGALLSYSLVAYGPYEMFKASINGTRGRLELKMRYEYQWETFSRETFTVYDQQGNRIIYDVPAFNVIHGGGDERLREMIFAGGIDDPLGQQAGSYDGAKSILIGAAANVSIAESRNVKISELVDLAPYRPEAAAPVRK